ncbi:MAG: hypothetical protein AB1644_04305 [Candidatus Zixiibacteriota bacterium]
MNKIIPIILAISIIGNLVGLFFAYQWLTMRRSVNYLQSQVRDASKVINYLTDITELNMPTRMVYLHHSVGKGFLYDGGLRDSLAQLGVAVKGATYGDEVGQNTDMCDWTTKFTADMQRIFMFKAHPNLYYTDGKTNDIVMFKSCYPNSYVESEGSGAGNPTDKKRTTENYKAAFASISKEMQKYPDKLFVYMTYPPMAAPETNPEAAKRGRAFNQWLMGEYLPSYKKETGLDNFVIFDLFDILADSNNVLRDEYRRENPKDSHPNLKGNQEVARRFMEFFKPVWVAWQKQGVQAVKAGR